MPGRRNAPRSPPGIPPPALTSMLAPHIPPPPLYTSGAVMASQPLCSYGTNIPYFSATPPPAFPSFATAHPLPTPYNNINNPFSRPLLVPVPAPFKYGWRRDPVLLPGTVGVSEVKRETLGYRNSNYVEDEVKRHSLKAPWPQVRAPGTVGVSEVKGETFVCQNPYLEDEVKRLSLKGQGLEEKVEGWKKEKQQSDGEVELLKSAVQDVTGMHGQAKEEAESRVQASESEKTKLSEDNAGLRLEFEALKAKVEDSGKEMERMKSLESEKWQQVSLVFDGEKSKLVKEMRAEISGLERRNSGLKKLNAGLNSRVEALIIEGERLRAQMRSSEAEKAKLAADTAAKIVGLELLNSNLKKENATLLMKTGVLNAHYTGLLARQEELQSKAGKTRALEMLVDSATSMLKSTSRKFQGLPKVEDDETANDDNIEDEELAMKNFDFNSEFGSELLAIEDLFKARTDKIEALEKELLLVREDWYVVED